MKYIPALALSVLVLGSIALAIMPSYLVSPMRSQIASDIALSHTLNRFATPLALINLVVGVILGLTIWRRPGSKIRSKVGVAFAMVVLVLAANATRGYLPEAAFAKLPEVVRVATYDAMHVQPEDLVLGVKLGDETAAYPIPIVGYHHIVNDRLADEPFVVTY